MKKVIDADKMLILERFRESDKDRILFKYESLNNWDDINFDCEGDLILWNE